MLTDHDAADDPPVRQLERQESAAGARADRGGHDLAGPGRALGRRLAGPGPDLRGHGQSPRFTEDQLATAPEVLLADVLGGRTPDLGSSQRTRTSSTPWPTRAARWHECCGKAPGAGPRSRRGPLLRPARSVPRRRRVAGTVRRASPADPAPGAAGLTDCTPAGGGAQRPGPD